MMHNFSFIDKNKEKKHMYILTSVCFFKNFQIPFRLNKSLEKKTDLLRTGEPGFLGIQSSTGGRRKNFPSLAHAYLETLGLERALSALEYYQAIINVFQPKVLK